MGAAWSATSAATAEMGDPTLWRVWGRQRHRRFAERDHKNIIQWTEADRGGHDSAHWRPIS